MGVDLNTDYWRLSGPEHFLDEILSDLKTQGGKNILVCRPRHATSGFRQALEARNRQPVTGHSQLEFSPISKLDPTGNPFAELCKGLGIDEAGCEDIPALLLHPRSRRKLIFVELGEDPVLWAKWKNLLSLYAHAYRARPIAEPAPICIVVEGRSGQGADKLKDIALAVRYEYGICDLHDMIGYAARRLRKHDMSPLQRQLAVAYTAHVALWDSDICDKLTEAKWPDLLHPDEILHDLAKQRCWQESGGAPSWFEGSEDFFAGADRMHSAFALASSPDEIERRLFCAQLTILLPYVEQRRPHLIKTLDKMLKVPHHDKDGRVIAEKHRLEIGHIDSQLKEQERGRSRPVSSMARREAGLLHEVRNVLSHLDIFEPSRLGELESCHVPTEVQRVRERRPPNR